MMSEKERLEIKEWEDEVERDGKLFEMLLEYGINLSVAESYVWKEKGVFIKEVQGMSRGKIESLFEFFADKNYDGHYSLFRFTTGYKASFGTPDLDSGAGRAAIKSLPNFPTANDAMAWALTENVNFYNEEVKNGWNK